MKNLLGIIAAIFLTTASYAQSNEQTVNYINKLSEPDELTGAVVLANSDIALNLVSTNTKVEGYRIRLFFDNSQAARSDSEDERNRYRGLFPLDRTYLEYNAPYFKLTAGNYLTFEEALMKWSMVVNYFNNAFIIKETVTINHFKKEYDFMGGGPQVIVEKEAEDVQ